MKRALVTVFLSIAAFAQSPNASPRSQLSRTQLLTNDRLTATLIEMPPSSASALHRHDHDLLSVFVTPASLEVVRNSGAPAHYKFSAGDVRFNPAPVTHAVKNIGDAPVRIVDIEFADQQGAQEKPKLKKSHYCNPGSKDACVTEDYLLCTTRFCVEDVTMTPGAKSTQHTHDTEHMLVALSDYTLDDDTVGKGITHRSVKSGGVEYLPAGITHVLTNTSNTTARFIAIIFK